MCVELSNIIMRIASWFHLINTTLFLSYSALTIFGKKTHNRVPEYIYPCHVDVFCNTFFFLRICSLELIKFHVLVPKGGSSLSWDKWKNVDTRMHFFTMALDLWENTSSHFKHLYIYIYLYIYISISILYIVYYTSVFKWCKNIRL